MSSGTNKQRLDQNNAKIQQITQALNRKVIGEGNYDTAKGLADGSLTEFVASDFGVTSLKSERFRDFTNLTKLDLTGVTNIPNYTAYGCTGITELVLDENTTNVGNNAFYGCNNNSLEVDLDFKQNLVGIGMSAFASCKVKTLKGYFSYISDYALQNSQSILTKVEIKVNGSINVGAFSDNVNVSIFNLDNTSNVTFLGQSAFAKFGASRTLPENNIFTFDFRNSTFTDTGTYTFNGSSSSSTNKYFNIYFPSTLSNIGTGAFRYSDHFNIYYKLVPTLSNTNAFQYATNFKNFFPYNLVYTAKNSTNWSSSANGIVDSIFGYAEENTFSLGDTLPDTDADGYALTWYSDVGMTTQVTTVSDPTAIYYCSVGAKIKTKLSTTSYQATLTVSDGTNTYSNGDLVPIGSTLTITAVGDSGYPDPYIFTLNGTNITSGDTYTVTNDTINIVCLYYDGVNPPVDPVFANNSPAQIKVAVDNGLHRLFWNIGDTKTITLTDDTTATLTYIDQQTNRYEKADETGYSNAVFELNPLLTTSVMNQTNTNVGGWPASYMCNTVMPTLYNLLPTEWKNIVSEVKVSTITSSRNTALTTANNKLFIAGAQEIWGNTYIYGVTNRSNYYYDEGYTQFDYYRIHNSDSYRIKQYNNSNTTWYLRSPLYNGLVTQDTYWNGVMANGTKDNGLSLVAYGVCAIFAI